MNAYAGGLKGLEKFFKVLDTFTSTDETRQCVQAIHVLSSTPDTRGIDDTIGEAGTTRLVATDGSVLAICDIETDLLTYAEKQLYIFKKILPATDTQPESVSYVTMKKRDLTEESLFPYPNVMGIIPGDIVPCESNMPCAFNWHNVKKYADLRAAYKGCKENKEYNYYMPNYTNARRAPTGAQFFFDKGILIIVMPLRSRYNMSSGGAPDPAPINEMLPGLFNETDAASNKQYVDLLNMQNEAYAMDSAIQAERDELAQTQKEMLENQRKFHR
jgi:hypothetical protein